MIREKFPDKKFPHFSLQEISAELYQRLTPLVPEFLQVSYSILFIIISSFKRFFVFIYIIIHWFYHCQVFFYDVI